MILRSLLFNAAFYVNIIVWMFAISPIFLMPRRWGWVAIRAWVHSTLWLYRVITGTRYEIRGREHLPTGGYIVAAKHQSFWETFALVPLFDDPAFIAKRELMWIPFFGWYLKKMQMIPVDRGKRSAALKAMSARVGMAIAKGRQILIFPEGTRRPAGAEPAYKYGVVHIYAETKATVVPIALNSGLYWPRRRFLRYPGTIIVDIQPPIEAGLPNDKFFAALQSRMETASDRLIVEAMESPSAPPLAPAVAGRLGLSAKTSAEN
ncbi:MAG: 1-acyl-sn-glycerol-3-phosphate acyltransferase [Hyphomicrobiales bacterium]|nr:1-acyl-sn-glycerol-3-phosphate acyltransferase [Hyphomicrobiales bacterium]